MLANLRIKNLKAALFAILFTIAFSTGFFAVNAYAASEEELAGHQVENSTNTTVDEETADDETVTVPTDESDDTATDSGTDTTTNPTNTTTNTATSTITNTTAGTTINKVVGGKWKKVAGGKWKYLTSDGFLKGFNQIKGKTYFFDAKGIMKAGWLAQDKAWYYFNKSGVMKTGWLKLGGKWYYLNPANGKMFTGKQIIDRRTYFFASSGVMKTGWNKEDGIWHYYARSGAQKTGWVKDRYWYYLDPTQNGAMKTGKYKVGNAWYISNDSGAMYSKKWAQTPEGWYYATSSGALKSGWHKSGLKWYWLQSDKDGLMFANAEKHIGGVHYAFRSDGAMYANSQVKLEDGACGYAASSGAITKIGEYDGNKVILKDAEGTTLTGWQKFAGKWFYANKEGVLQTGWITDKGKRYFLNSQGVLSSNYAASQKLVAAAKRVPYQGNGWCAKWTNTVYTAAGYAHPNGNACDLYWKYCKISDLSQMEPGMIIAVPSHARSALGRIYGHVALYMGNGMVRHNTSRLETIPLSQWLDYYQTIYKAKCGWAF